MRQGKCLYSMFNTNEHGETHAYYDAHTITLVDGHGGLGDAD